MMLVDVKPGQLVAVRGPQRCGFCGRGGSPVMTVCEVSDWGTVRAFWFTANERVQYGEFQPSVLDLVEEARS